MVLLGLNIGLVVASLLSVLIGHALPGFLAFACGAVGGVTIYSRIKIWKTGTAKKFYDLVQDNEAAMKKMRTMDSMFWGTAIFNLVVFLLYLAK